MLICFLIFVTTLFSIYCQQWLFLLAIIPLLICAISASTARRRVVFFGVLIIIGLGCYLANNTLEKHDARELPLHFFANKVILEGKMTRLPVVKDRLVQFEFLTENISGALLDKPRKIKLALYRDTFDVEDIKQFYRHRLSIKARLKPIVSHINGVGFDAEKNAFITGIAARGTISKKRDIKTLDRLNRHVIEKARLNIYTKLYTLQKADMQRNFYDVIAALLIGDRGLIKTGTFKTFSELGLTHLIAISGLHLGLVVGCVVWCLSALYARFLIQDNRITKSECQAILLLIGVWFYAAFAGFGVPIVRASLGASCWAILRLCHIELRPITLLSLIGFILLLIHPEWVLSASFWLSWSACLAIGLIYSLVTHQPWYLQWLCIQIGLALLLKPVLHVFDLPAANLAFIANLYSVPAMGFLILPLILISACGLLFLPDTANVFWLSNAVLEIWWQSLQAVQSLIINLESYIDAFIQTTSIVFGIVAGLFVCLIFWQLQRDILRKHLMIGLLLIMIPAQSEIPEETFDLDVLDIGQGLAILMRHKSMGRSNYHLYDLGVRYGDYNSFDAWIKPLLKSYGVTTLQTVTLSHADRDHIGGLEALLRADFLSVEQFVRHIPIKSLAHVPNQMHCSSRVQLSPYLSFHWFYVPSSIKKGRRNDQSCILRIQFYEKMLLIPGDIEREAEQNWLNAAKLSKMPPLKADIVVAPHHGSQTSSTEAWLKHVKPSTVIVASGYLNRYKMPAESVVSRYQQYDIKMYNTAVTGLVRVHCNKNACETNTLRHRNPRAFRQTTKRLAHAQTVIRTF